MTALNADNDLGRREERKGSNLVTNCLVAEYCARRHARLRPAPVHHGRWQWKSLCVVRHIEQLANNRYAVYERRRKLYGPKPEQ